MLTTVAKRAVLYLRISRDREGRALGVERQEEDGRARIEREGWTLVGVYVDNDIGASSKSKKPRPRYRDVIELVERGEAGIIWSYSTSRLTRRPMEFEKLIQLHDDRGVRIVTEGGDIDLDTASGRMIARVLAAKDAEESEQISERVRRQQRQARENGRRHGGGPRPFGWHRDMVVGQPTIYRERESEADLLRKAVDDILAGVPIGQVIREWNAEGVTTSTGQRWEYGLFRSVLRRESNALILGEEKHRALMAFLAYRVRRTAPAWEPRHLVAGLATCGRCGGRLRSGTLMAADRGRYRVYRCTGTTERGTQCGTAVKEQILDDAVRQAVVTAYSLELPGQLPTIDTDVSAAILAARAELAGIAATKARNLRLVEDGDYTEAELSASAKELNKRAVLLERRIAELVERNAHERMTQDLVTHLMHAGHAARIQLADRFDRLPLDQRRLLIRSLFDITVHRGRGPERVEIARRA